MTQINITSGSSVSVSLPAGQRLLLSGQGTYRIGPRGTSQRPTVDEQIDTLSTIGPYENVCSVQIWATGAGAVYESVAPSDVLDQTGRPISGDSLRPIAQGARRQLRYVNFLGDSLTNHSFIPIIPRGVGGWQVTGISNLNSVGGWIANQFIDGRAPSGGGTLETDGAGRLRWTFTADSAGPWVDVSNGGFFEIPSATANRGIYVAICKSQQRPSATSDALTTTGVVQSNTAQPIYYPSWAQGALGQAIEYQHWGISGDNLAGVETRWQAAVANNPDALVLQIGTNDAPATAAAADALAARYTALVEQIITRVPVVYIGGLFPRTDVAAATRQSLARFSESLRKYAQTRPLQVKFWDAWPRMVSPSASDGSFRTGVAHTDNLHLTPYGAQVASEDLVAQIRQDWAVPTTTNRCRGFAPWDSTSRSGSINTNPMLKGTAGTVVASRGITGSAPDSWTVDRAGGAGSTQTLTLSTAATASGQDAIVFTVANAGASDYHELSQSVTLPVGVVVGDYIAIELDFQVQQATLLSTLQAQANSNGNIQSTYLLQPVRVLSTFASGVSQPFMRLRSEPMLIASGVTSFTLRLRIGGGAGSSGVVVVERFEMLRVS